MNPFDTIVRSLFRGYGWGLGRRLAYRTPLWLAVVLVILYLVTR